MTSLIPNNHVTNSLDLLHKMQENLDLVHKIQVVGKHGYFTSKTGSSHTSQDKGVNPNMGIVFRLRKEGGS